MKDYYAVLGVLPSIEQSALKAVYAALMKKYHPDVTTLPKQEAELRAKEINEAYSVLGDVEKRAAYDEQRKQSSSQSGDYNQERTSSSGGDSLGDQFQTDWQTVVSYFPDAEECRLRLRKISYPLSETFQILIISQKLARQAKDLSQFLEREFLTNYFGDNEVLHQFVVFLIEIGARDALLEINNYIRVIGAPQNDEVDPFIGSIVRKFKVQNWGRSIRREDIKGLSAKKQEGSDSKIIYLAILFYGGKIVGWNPSSRQYELFGSYEDFANKTKLWVPGFTRVDDIDKTPFLSLISHLRLK